VSNDRDRMDWKDNSILDRFSYVSQIHPEKKTGWIPRDPEKPIIKFSVGLAAVPSHPLVDLWPVSSTIWPMDRNDQAGDCVVAAVDHALQAIALLLGIPRTNWTDDQILAYYQTQNPNFRSWADSGGPNDQGMVIQDFLSYLVKTGVILGFGLVDHTNEEQLKAAAYLGLANVTGEILDVAQQTQQVWDYAKGSPVWGGHATCSIGYGDSQGKQTDLFRVVTWGSTLVATPSFFTKQVEEVYFILTNDLVAHPAFRENYSLNSFAAAFTSLTGRPFPVPTPTPPGPGPSVSDQQLLAAYTQYRSKRDLLDSAMDDVMNHWAAGKNFG
jgi:hypothetical protein